MSYKFSKEDEEFLHKTWQEWVRGEKLGKYKLGMSYMDFRHLYKFFLDTCKKSGISSGGSIPPYWGEIWDMSIDKTASKEANMARVELEVTKMAPKTPMEVESYVEEGKVDADMIKYLDTMAHEMGKEIVSKDFAEKVGELEGTIQRLKEEKKRRRLAEKSVEEAVTRIRALKDALARKEKELKMRPPVEIVKLRVLKDFKEGLVTYRTGQILKLSEPADIEWAKRKILEGYLEEVPLIERKPVLPPPIKVAPPPSVKVVPPTAPPEEIFKPKVKWTKELERKLKDVFDTTLRAGLPEEGITGLSPHKFWGEFRLELEGTKTLKNEREMVQHITDLAKAILKREGKPVKPPPTLPPGWRKVKGGYLVNGRFIREEEFPGFPPTRRPRLPMVTLKPPAIGPTEWRRYVKKIDDVTWWKKMTAEERKKVYSEYLRLCGEETE